MVCVNKFFIVFCYFNCAKLHCITVLLFLSRGEGGGFFDFTS